MIQNDGRLAEIDRIITKIEELNKEIEFYRNVLAKRPGYSDFTKGLHAHLRRLRRQMLWRYERLVEIS